MPFTKENPEIARTAGRKGGKSNVKNNGRDHMATIGKMGGDKVNESLGREHYSKIGKQSWSTRKRTGGD